MFFFFILGLPLRKKLKKQQFQQWGCQALLPQRTIMAAVCLHLVSPTGKFTDVVAVKCR
jgi:hypothetical protein